jgi:hypothetical protein
MLNDEAEYGYNPYCVLRKLPAIPARIDTAEDYSCGIFIKIHQGQIEEIG